MNRLPGFFKTLKQPPLYLFWGLVIFFITLFLLSLIYFGFINFGARPAVPLTQDAGLPIPASDSIVKTASVFYTLGGTIEEADYQGTNILKIKLRSEEGNIYPRVFTVFLAEAIFSQVGNNFTDDPLSQIKKGKKVELLYTVDLKSKESEKGVVTQVFLQD